MDDHSATLPEGGRPATESLLHTQRIAEGLFDISRGAGGRSAGGPGSSDYDRYCSKLPLVEGRVPDAFDVSLLVECRGRGGRGGGGGVTRYERLPFNIE